MEPGTGGVPTSGSSPAGFEMRWWAWERGWNDVVADIFLQILPQLVSVVQPGVGATVSKAKRLAGFRLASEVACGLPGAGCSEPDRSALV